MSITVDLPQDLENELSAEAAQLGISVSEYVLRIISTELATGKKPKTGAELVDYWQREGLVGSRPDISDSQAHAREIREQAEHRFRE